MDDLDKRFMHVLGEFDFYKVQKVMEALDWKWSDIGGIPSVPDMVEVVVGLWKTQENTILRQEEFGISTGGFELYGSKDIDGNYILGLSFIVESIEYTTPSK